MDLTIGVAVMGVAGVILAVVTLVFAWRRG